MTVERSHRRWWVLLATLVAVGATVTGLAVGLAGVRAQDDAESHPAHFHSGTCADLGDVVFPLANISLDALMDGTPMAAGAEMMGPDSATPVKSSVTTVAAALTDIVEGGHALNVHESEENIGTYIACGDVGGMMVGGRLVIGLQELNDSGHAGVAILEDQGEETLVTVYLVEGAAGGAADNEEGDETPAATGDGGESAVTIAGFAYDPAEVTIPVGGTVTWTNQDNARHTATAQDRDALQTGTIEPGASASQTFDAAGTYDYFCEFHPNMSGTVVVE